MAECAFGCFFAVPSLAFHVATRRRMALFAAAPTAYRTVNASTTSTMYQTSVGTTMYNVSAATSASKILGRRLRPRPLDIERPYHVRPSHQWGGNCRAYDLYRDSPGQDRRRPMSSRPSGNEWCVLWRGPAALPPTLEAACSDSPDSEARHRRAPDGGSELVAACAAIALDTDCYLRPATRVHERLLHLGNSRALRRHSRCLIRRGRPRRPRFHCPPRQAAREHLSQSRPRAGPGHHRARQARPQQAETAIPW